MSKLVLLLSLLGTAILFSFGLTNPDSPVVWLASTSMNFAALRLVMMLVLAALLVTHPPRNVYLRMFVGGLAIVLAGWSLMATYENEMKLLDSLSLLQFSISAGLIVLESKYIPIETMEERIEHARQTRLATSLSTN
jgi:hypothetical protein